MKGCKNNVYTIQNWLQVVWGWMIGKAHARTERKLSPLSATGRCDEQLSTPLHSVNQLHRAAYLGTLKRPPIKFNTETDCDYVHNSMLTSSLAEELLRDDKFDTPPSPTYCEVGKENCYSEVNTNDPLESLQLMDFDMGDLSSLNTLEDFMNKICQMCGMKAEKLLYTPCCGSRICALCWTYVSFCDIQQASCLSCCVYVRE